MASIDGSPSSLLDELTQGWIWRAALEGVGFLVEEKEAEEASEEEMDRPAC